MNWNHLTQLEQLNTIKSESSNHPVLLFKHSTRCSISSMALDRLQRAWNQEELGDLKPYYLDLINNRDISNAIAQEFGVDHESPQIIIISDGKAIYDNSHMGIAYHEVKRVNDNLQEA
ncbi:bacillithiol system redox-active protein YtxJ [Reichenbachiella versicolor]|uniref:bacillithiol system redox-active protein YtxJ n=1 Tax=Reichenbachiella versicolor TaxID=1821036 RepID=UPI000D6DF0FB|nr:bacillithiol system redox-active protein YtxJ [Reichenbachiella versicolor]